MAVIDGLTDEELRKLLEDIVASEGGGGGSGAGTGGGSTGLTLLPDANPNAPTTGPRGRSTDLFGSPGNIPPEIQSGGGDPNFDIDTILGGFGFDKATNPDSYNYMRRLLFPENNEGGFDSPSNFADSPSTSSRPAAGTPEPPGVRLSSPTSDQDFFDGLTLDNVAKRTGDKLTTFGTNLGNYLQSRTFGNDAIRTVSNLALPFSGTFTGAAAERQQINAFNDRMKAMGLDYRYNESVGRTLGENFVASLPPPLNFLRDPPKFPTIFEGGEVNNPFSPKGLEAFLRAGNINTGSGITISRKPTAAKPKIMKPAPAPSRSTFTPNFSKAKAQSAAHFETDGGGSDFGGVDPGSGDFGGDGSDSFT